MRAKFTTVLAAASALFVSVGAAQAEEEKVLNVYNWSDYVAQDTLEKFTAATGIKVNYDVYDSNEILEAKLSAGKSGYDVVFPSASPFFAQQIKAGVYQKLDQGKLTNAAALDKSVMKTLESADPGNAYGVPYMMAATGIGYNVDKVKKLMGDAPVGSWGLLFDAAATGKLKDCGISMLDTPTETVPAALAFTGRDATSQKTEDLTAAMDTLGKVRPHLKYIHSSKYINDLAKGNLCVAHGYVGDLVQARSRGAEAKKKVNIEIFIPKEGAPVNIDVMAVPKDAPHPDNAHTFINFLLTPEIIAAVSNETGYANAVTSAANFLDASIRNDPVIYPPADVLAKEFTVPTAGKEYEHARTRAWTKYKNRY